MPMRAFLGQPEPGSLSGVLAAAFDPKLHSWFAGSAAKQIERWLLQLACNVVVPAENFYVAGGEGPLAPWEVQRAQAWADLLLARALEKVR